MDNIILTPRRGRGMLRTFWICLPLRRIFTLSILTGLKKALSEL